MSDSPRGGDGTPGCLPHRFTHRTARPPACPAHSHQPHHPLVRDPHHFHHPALHRRPRPFRPLDPLLPHPSEPTTNHEMFMSSRRHRLRLPHLLYLQHTKADPTHHLTSHRSKIQHGFLREAHFMTLTSLTLIVFLPIRHPRRPLRMMRAHLTSTLLTLRLTIRLSFGRWRF